ncbi:MAG: hypothetical protein U0531_13685 [Dehalococcoidia bacterium]
MNMLPPDRVERAARDAAEEQAYWHGHYQDLLRQYPERFVAVVAGEVVASAGSLAQLLEATARRGLQPGEFWLRFVTSDIRTLLS